MVNQPTFQRLDDETQRIRYLYQRVYERDPSAWDRSRSLSHSRSCGLSHHWCCRVADRSPRKRTPLGTLRKTRSQLAPGIWRAAAGRGRAGQAFAPVESGVVDRATANSLPRTAAATNRMTRPPRRSPPSGSCSRILDQSLEPARVRASRNQPLERASAVARLARGWAGRSPPLTPKRSLRIEHPIRTFLYRALVTHRSNQVLCLSCDNSLLESRFPPRDASAGRSRLWPGCCPRQRVCPIPGRVDSW